MESNETVYIYALINPLTDLVFYIGASKDPVKRLKAHCYERWFATDFKGSEITKILNAGKNVDLLILDECEHIESRIRYLETFYIHLFKFYGFSLKQKNQSDYSCRSKTGKRIQGENYLEPLPRLKNKIKAITNKEAIGKCKDCAYWTQYSDYKMKCNFYGSMPFNALGDSECKIDNNTIFGFEKK